MIKKGSTRRPDRPAERGRAAARRSEERASRDRRRRRGRGGRRARSSVGPRSSAHGSQGPQEGHAEGMARAAAALALAAEVAGGQARGPGGAVVEVALEIASRLVDRELADERRRPSWRSRGGRCARPRRLWRRACCGWRRRISVRADGRGVRWRARRARRRSRSPRTPSSQAGEVVVEVARAAVSTRGSAPSSRRFRRALEAGGA